MYVRRKLEHHSRQQRLSALDREHILKGELRLSRISALEALKETVPEAVRKLQSTTFFHHS